MGPFRIFNSNDLAQGQGHVNIRMGPFVNSYHLMNIVQFQDLRLTLIELAPSFMLTSHMMHLDSLFYGSTLIHSIKKTHG